VHFGKCRFLTNQSCRAPRKPQEKEKPMALLEASLQILTAKYKGGASILVLVLEVRGF
jgi:hypothetical protein